MAHEDSEPTRSRGPRLLLIGALVGLDALARLSLFAAIGTLFVARDDRGREAAIVAVVAALSGLGRSLLRGELLRGELEAGWAALVRAVRRKDVRALLTPENRERVPALVDATYEVAFVDAAARPDTLGATLSLAIVAFVAGVRLGVGWLAAGVVAGALLVGVLAPVRRAVRRARITAWDAQLVAGGALETLVAGSAELRAQGLEAEFAERMGAPIAELASSERRGARWAALSSALPMALAVALPWVPHGVLDVLAGARAGEVAVLASAGAAYAWVLVGGLEALARVAPARAMLSAFVTEPSGAAARGVVAPTTPAAPIVELRVSELSVRHPGADAETPRGLSFSIAAGGIALVGPNGAGKSTALLAIAGVHAASAGRVELVDGTGRAFSPSSAGRAFAYFSQRPHVVAERSIAWHLRSLGTSPVSEERLLAALERTCVLPRLAELSASRGMPVLELAMGSLSGGERQRVLLSRLLLADGRVALLDEPEAGLDLAGRHMLRALLEELAKTRPIVLVAHDEHIIPPSFPRLEVARGEA